jgi:hypothetical protein
VSSAWCARESSIACAAPASFMSMWSSAQSSCTASLAGSSSRASASSDTATSLSPRARASCAAMRSGSAGEGSRRSMKARTWASGRAPVNSSTSLPATKALTLGMPRTPQRAAISGFWSEFSLARTKRPPYSAASFSSTGLSARQGAHHSAQKSTSTGARCEASMTFSWKSAVATSSENGFMARGISRKRVCRVSQAWRRKAIGSGQAAMGGMRRRV